jgi:hypothetical protein
MDAWLGTTYTLELLKLTWDFKHHYSSAHVSLLEFFMDWPKLNPSKLIPGDKFTFKESEAVYYEDDYWRFDLVQVLSKLLGSSF